jgi:RNA polymerase sigma-70 factor, ECF subfamily
MTRGPDHETTRAEASDMRGVREHFAQKAAELRAELHRYCARMTGSVFDGEDVVQEALTRAHHALAEMTEPPALGPWIFRIAHNVAMDHLKRYERKHVELVPEVPEAVELEEESIDPELVQAALSRFVALPPLQRSALILKDVLGHPLSEIASTLGTSISATKAALWRARAGLERESIRATEAPAHTFSRDEAASLQRYVDLFNQRNWDALRNLLTEEAELDLVTRLQKRVVDAGYYSRYAQILELEHLRAEPGLADGVPAIAMFRPSAVTPAYFVLLAWEEGRVARIRDFYHVPYIANDATFSPGSRH